MTISVATAPVAVMTADEFAQTKRDLVSSLTRSDIWLPDGTFGCPRAELIRVEQCLDRESWELLKKFPSEKRMEVLAQAVVEASKRRRPTTATVAVAMG